MNGGVYVLGLLAPASRRLAPPSNPATTFHLHAHQKMGPNQTRAIHSPTTTVRPVNKTPRAPTRGILRAVVAFGRARQAGSTSALGTRRQIEPAGRAPISITQVKSSGISEAVGITRGDELASLAACCLWLWVDPNQIMHRGNKCWFDYRR